MKVYLLTPNGVVDTNDVSKMNQQIDMLASTLRDEVEMLTILVESQNYELAQLTLARLSGTLEQVVHVQHMTPQDSYEFSFDYRKTDDFVPLTELHQDNITPVEYVANGEVRI